MLTHTHTELVCNYKGKLKEVNKAEEVFRISQHCAERAYVLLDYYTVQNKEKRRKTNLSLNIIYLIMLFKCTVSLGCILF